MRPFYAIVVFILVALVYSHLVQEFAPSSVPGGGGGAAVQAEVYELDYSDPATFHDTCRVRHPVVILDPPAYPSSISTRQECLRRFPQHTLYVKHRQDYPLDVEGIDVRFDTAMTGMFSTPTPPAAATNEAVSDVPRSPCSPYFTENNGNGFLRETGIDHTLAEEGDAALAPPMTSYRAYDWMTGGAGATTPLRYHTYSRRYWRVVEGPSVRIKLIPWTYTRHLHERRDYDTYEFFSEVDVWDPHANTKPAHAADLARIAASRGIAEIELHCGQMLYLPPYWWYSVQYPSAGTVIVEHTYATYMNRLANLGDLGRHWLQRSTSYYTTLLPSTRASRQTETVLDSEPNNDTNRPVDVVEPEATADVEPLDIPL